MATLFDYADPRIDALLEPERQLTIALELIDCRRRMDNGEVFPHELRLYVGELCSAMEPSFISQNGTLYFHCPVCETAVEHSLAGHSCFV